MKKSRERSRQLSMFVEEVPAPPSHKRTNSAFVKDGVSRHDRQKSTQLSHLPTTDKGIYELAALES